MKKHIFIPVLSLLLVSAGHTIAQQKFKIVEQKKWQFDYWYKIFSYSKFANNQVDLQFDLGVYRFFFMQIGFLSAFVVSDANWLDEDGTTGTVTRVLKSQFPAGLYLPLHTDKLRYLPYSIGVNLRYYIFFSEDQGYEEEVADKLKLPYLVDLSFLIDTHCLSVEAGYRFQFGKYLWPDERYESGNYEAARFDGFFLKVSAGLSKLKLKEKIVEKRYLLPNPSLKIVVTDSSKNNTIKDGEEKNISFVVENQGAGIAEEIVLYIYAKTDFSEAQLIKTHLVGDLKPFSKKLYFIPVSPPVLIEEEKNITLNLLCLDIDGFRAYEKIDVKVIPR